jgi:hypothetical protein
VTHSWRFRPNAQRHQVFSVTALRLRAHLPTITATQVTGDFDRRTNEPFRPDLLESLAVVIDITLSTASLPRNRSSQHKWVVNSGGSDWPPNPIVIRASTLPIGLAAIQCRNGLSECICHPEWSIPWRAPRSGSKVPCSLTDQRNRRLNGRLTTRKEILWWKICAEIGPKSGRFSLFKLLIINDLTRWRREGDSNPR